MTTNINENGGKNHVIKSIKVKLYVNDREKNIIKKNISNASFVWNKYLKKCKYENVKPTKSQLNDVLKDLKKEYPFLKESEASSLQQVYNDLIRAFNKHKNEGFGYPKFKTKNNPKNSYRIQYTNNNIRLNKRQNRVKIPKIGYVKFKTSKEYKKLINESKINNITIKIENGIYYGIINIKTEHNVMEHTGKAIGIDIGIRRPLTCSDGLTIPPLDLTYEEKKIRYYKREMDTKKLRSNSYRAALRKYRKWSNKRKNKKKDMYNKLTHFIVKENSFIVLETLNIRGWFKNRRWSPKLQQISPYQILEQLKYKSQWNHRKLIQINRYFPSSQICSKCGKQNKDLKISNEEWTCPYCGQHHDRDLNASINIKNEGIRRLNEKIKKIILDLVYHDLRCAGDSSVRIYRSVKAC